MAYGRRKVTLQDLVRLTPEVVRARGVRGCRPMRKSYTLTTREGWGGYRGEEANELKIDVRCTRKAHTAYIRFYGPPDLKTPVWVWCDCDMFKYYLEVALTRVGASSIMSSNGKSPTVRNAQMIPYLCKHLVVGANLALQEKDLRRAPEDEMEANPIRP